MPSSNDRSSLEGGTARSAVWPPRASAGDRSRRGAPGDRTARLYAALATSSLFENRAMQGGVNQVAIEHSDTCWMGVGLSGRALSVAVPLDVLQMVFAQEILRRAIGLRRSFILIADCNARRVGFNDLEVQRAQSRLRTTLEAACSSFGFPVSVVAASTMHDAREAEILARRIGVPNVYMGLQLAQMQLMRRLGAGIKVGWAAPGLAQDERAFDRLHDQLFAQPLAYVYTKAGCTLHPSRPRCSPYVCERPESRLLLERGENLGRKLQLASARHRPLARAYRRLLARLSRAHRALVGPDQPMPPLVRLQLVVDRLAR